MKACDHCATELPDEARFCFVCGADLLDTAGAPAVARRSPEEAIGELKARLTSTLDGRYRIRKVLGSGGMGVVFLADDLSLARPVAIKVLPDDLAADKKVVARFRREAKTAASLDHPGIIPVLAVESDGGLHYFIMKYVAGRTLEELLQGGRPLPIPFVTQVLRDAAAALAHAHANGVVHRDVKPANIMLEDDDRVILTDFGISKVTAAASSEATTAARLTDLGMVVGTPHYMAPEQAVGHAVDGRTDQYALAVVGFEMLAGRVPFDDVTPHAIIQRHINAAPPDLAALRPDAPANLVATISRGLLKAPANRFATMNEFGAALAGAGSRATANVEFTVPIANASVTVAEPTAPRARRRQRRSLAPWFAVAAIVLSGAGAAAAWVSGGRETEKQVAKVAPVRPTTAKPKTPATSPGKDTRRRSAALSVESKPRATIFINDMRAGDTPLVNRQLTVGREYRIRVERAGYRTRRETITPAGSAPIRRSYVLERVKKR